MKLAILVLVTIFIGNIAMAGVSTSKCPLKAGGSLQTRKPDAHSRLMPATAQAQKATSKPANSTDNKL